jgi:carbon storage regulator CsrA
MLVLTRKPREEIRIGDGITITVLRVKGQSVRIGIQAPNEMRIVRGELEIHGDDLASLRQEAQPNCVEPPCPVSQKSTTKLVKSEPACRSLPLPATSTNSSLPCSSRFPKTERNSSTLKILAARRRALRETQSLVAPVTSLEDQPTIPLRNTSPK